MSEVVTKVDCPTGTFGYDGSDYIITVTAFRDDWNVKEFRSIEKPIICTIDGSNGTPVALEVVADNLELILPLGTVIEVNEAK